MDFVSSLPSTSWYFLLATLLPIFATLLALIWGYYSSSARKKNATQKQLLKGGSFGYNIVKDKNFDDYHESSVSDKMNTKKSTTNGDKRPLIDTDELDNVVKMSDIEIPKLDDDTPGSPPKQKPIVAKSNEFDDDDDDDDEDEKFDYTDIPGKLKSSKFIKATRELEKDMTEEQKREEAEVRQKQLESIFKLMREQEEKFGTQSNDELQEQMKLYAL